MSGCTLYTKEGTPITKWTSKARKWDYFITDDDASDEKQQPNYILIGYYNEETQKYKFDRKKRGFTVDFPWNKAKYSTVAAIIPQYDEEVRIPDDHDLNMDHIDGIEILHQVKMEPLPLTCKSKETFVYTIKETDCFVEQIGEDKYQLTEHGRTFFIIETTKTNVHYVRFILHAKDCISTSHSKQKCNGLLCVDMDDISVDTKHVYEVVDSETDTILFYYRKIK